MPPQKNSGAKSSKRVSGVESKNARFIQTYLDDIRRKQSTENVYVARIIARLGDGRMDAFYLDEENKPQTAQVVIRGSFRSKGKRSVWIEVGSIVIIASSGIPGSAEFGIMAILSQEDLNALKREITIDPRILDTASVDKVVLKSDIITPDGGFEFDTAEDEIDIEDI